MRLIITALLTLSSTVMADSFECRGYCLKISRHKNGLTMPATVKVDSAEEVKIRTESLKPKDIKAQFDQACGKERVFSSLDRLSDQGTFLDFVIDPRAICKKQILVPVHSATTETTDGAT